MKYKVYITAPYLQLELEKYRHLFDGEDVELVVPPVNERFEEEELLKFIGEADAILCGDDRITKRVIDAAPKLKVISKWGTGIDSIDKEYAASKGIPVRNTPNAFTEPVADCILGCMLVFSRGILELDQEMKAGQWNKRLYPALHERTLGIIGMGNVGKGIRKRALSFGMKVLGNDIKDTGVENMVSLEQLLKESDFVTINTDLNPTSQHLMNKETFAQMKPTAYFFNMARGPVMDEAALIEALQNKVIAGAALDVFEKEPLPKDSPLLKMKNVILSPHNANAGIAAWDNVHKSTIEHALEELHKHQ